VRCRNVLKRKEIILYRKTVLGAGTVNHCVSRNFSTDAFIDTHAPKSNLHQGEIHVIAGGDLFHG
jgi:hypothetical protein